MFTIVSISCCGFSCALITKQLWYSKSELDAGLFGMSYIHDVSSFMFFYFDSEQCVDFCTLNLHLFRFFYIQ